MSVPARSLLAALLLALAAAAPASAIVGGQTTQREWPHMAGMEYFADANGDGTKEWSFRCGGSLVAPDVVLSAAHCVDDTGNDGVLKASDFRFLLGTKLRSDRTAERLTVVEIREHPGYNGSNETGSDVALLKLERASARGRTIRLGQTADLPRWEPGDEATIIGWGAEFSEGPSPDALKEASIPIVADATCQASYRFTLGFDPATSVCAGNAQGGEDSCQGDSGGPLMVQDAAGAWILVGDTSFGLGCAFPTQYGVYGEVGGNALRPWVEQNVAQMSSAGGLNANPASPAGLPGATGSPSPQPTQSGSGSGTGSTGAQAPPSAAPTTPAATSRVRVTLPARLRSAKRLRLSIRSTAALRSVRVTLRVRRRTVASGRTTSLRGRRTVTLRARRTVRAGRAVLRLTAVGPNGQRVTVSRRVQIRR